MKKEQELRFSERVLHDMSSAVLVVDRKGNVVYVNQPASEILEIEDGLRDGLRKERYSFFSENSYNDAFYGAILDAFFRKGETSFEKEVPFMAPSGKKYWFQLSSSFLEGKTEDDALLVVTIDDQTETELVKKKLNDSSRTFTTFLFGFCIWILIYALWEFLKQPVSSEIMTHGVELLGLVMLFFIMHHTSLTWHDLGVWTDKPKETVRTGLIVAVCSVALLFIIKAVARIIVPTSFRPDRPFLDVRLFGIPQIVYILTAGIQEFLARSVVQGNLMRIMVGKHTAAKAIVLSSVIFAALHIHLGFIFMIGAAILAGLEGILYEKQRNIFGVWIVHWVFGVFGTMLSLIDH